MMLNSWSVNDPSVPLPKGMISNLYHMLEEFERRAFENSGWDKFSIDVHGSKELLHLKRLAENISWEGPGNR